MSVKRDNLTFQIRRSIRRTVMIATILGIFSAGFISAYSSFLQAKRIGSLVENQAKRIVNNAIINQDLLSIQSDFARLDASVKETLDVNIYSEIYINSKLIAQTGVQSRLSKHEHLSFVRKTNLQNGSVLELKVFPDYEQAFYKWSWSVLIICVLAMVLSFAIEMVLALQVKKWISPFLDKVNEIRGITKAIKSMGPRRISESKTESLEIYELTDAVNRLLSAIETSQAESSEYHLKLIETERKSAKDRAIAEISMMIGHDLRAPLHIFERLLLDDDIQLSADTRSAIRNSLYRLHAMIESFRHGEVENIIRMTTKDFVLSSGIELLSPVAIARNIEFIVPNSLSIKLSADHDKLERAWVNLVNNALDFAKSKVKIEVETEGSTFVFRVIDDGSGVANELLPKLFQRGATYGKSDGTGLGLAYVRQIMRGHGGDVKYRREKSFTIFECRLPNAVTPEKEQLLENSANLEVQLVQNLVTIVAVCLEPKALSRSVKEKLASFESDGFFFTEERDKAKIVVSNIEDIMFEVLESDDKEFVSVSQLDGDEMKIVTMLKRKFNLT